MDELARRHLGHQPITFSDVAGTGRAKVTFDRVALDKATAYAAEDADVTLRLWRMMKPRLVAEKRVAVYETRSAPWCRWWPGWRRTASASIDATC